jgi:uncharacterized SAM-binding protein YcdF (DUF218 family)
MWIKRQRGLLRNLLAALGFWTAIITFTPAVAWYARLLAGPWNDPGGKTLIVLGGESTAPRVIGLGTYWRVVYAAKAYREGGFERIVLTGAGVAEGMSDFLRAQGVPAGALQIETRARDTRENALNLRAMLAGAPEPVVLMTSDYHMFRARRVFTRLGIAVLARPIPDATKRAVNASERWSVFMGEAVETAKIGYYFLRGWI